MAGPDPKPEPRIKDSAALRRARLSMRGCAACGGPSSNAHHVMQKGSPYMGDDVPENIVLLCGSGTSLCHGAWHGSPYVTQVGHWCLDVERRDQKWVAWRIGRHLLAHRLDTIEYVIRKLGYDAASAYLERSYLISAQDLASVRPQGSRG